MQKEIEIMSHYEHTTTTNDHKITQHPVSECADYVNPIKKSVNPAMTTQDINQWLVLGLAYLNTAAFTEALQVFNRVLDNNPQDTMALIHKHDTLVAMGHNQIAFQLIEQIKEMVPHDARVLRRLADHRTNMRLVWDEAGKKTKQLIQATLQMTPTAAEIHESLAYYHLFRGEWQQGNSVLHTFITQHPNHPRGWYYYARCLFHTGDFQAAANAILKAYTLYQNDYSIYQALCEILPHANKADELQIPIEEMLKRFSERWQVWLIAGQVQVDYFNNPKEGYQLSAQGLRLQLQLAEPWFLHGQILKKIGKYREAIDAFEYGWKLLPAQDNYLQAVIAATSLGEGYCMMGHTEASRSWWEKASQAVLKLKHLNPAVAYYWQGKILTALDKIPEALRAYNTALNYHLLYPAHQEVKAALRQLRIWGTNKTPLC